MSRTWIIYNRPEEPNAVHAGLLLALGLHGYLCVLTITDIYQYYAPVRHLVVFTLVLFIFNKKRLLIDMSCGLYI